MKILIVYKSRTGFSKRYAEMISNEVPSTLMDYKTVTSDIMSQFDIVVYGTRVHAGIIDGLKKTREMFHKSNASKFIIFVTGATPNSVTSTIDEIWKNNLLPNELANDSHFYMQSGICYEKLGFFDRMIMKMVSKMLSKSKNNDNIEKGFQQAITSSHDISSKEYAKPLINYLIKI